MMAIYRNSNLDLKKQYAGENAMKAIGLDIGTTTICALLIDADSGAVIKSKTVDNSSALSTQLTWEKTQDPEKIMTLCLTLINDFKESYNDIIGIGMTGQMHGILYCNQEGKAVSPFYTWQDMRGSQAYQDGKSYAEFLSEKTGYFMASGFGMVTHFYNQINGLIPEDAHYFCNIQDYVAMRLINSSTPLVHPTNAAAFGAFDLTANKFDLEALEKAGVLTGYLPKIFDDNASIGKTGEGIAVCCAIGDNQASFFGSVASDTCILINVGTGSQISVISNDVQKNTEIEYRPYLFHNYLAVGCAICGGYAYNLLKNFFVQTIEMLGGSAPADIYDIMNSEAEKIYVSADKLKINTQFRGTRKNPALRGSIREIGTDNFTPQALILGFLEGMCDELYTFYEKMTLNHAVPLILVGSGNGIRKNLLLQSMFSERFGMELKIPQNEEEAAFGTALFCLYTLGHKSIQDVQSFIKYKN